MGSCPDTDIDPQSLHFHNIIKVSVFGLWSLVCVLKTFHGSGKKKMRITLPFHPPNHPLVTAV